MKTIFKKDSSAWGFWDFTVDPIDFFSFFSDFQAVKSLKHIENYSFPRHNTQCVLGPDSMVIPLGLPLRSTDRTPPNLSFSLQTSFNHTKCT